MKFKDIYMLALREEFEFDVIANGEELSATVVPTQLTEDGWKFFEPLFESEINLIVPPPVAHSITVVEFLEKEVAELADFFVTAQAGYIGASQYDRLFGETSNSGEVVYEEEQCVIVKCEDDFKYMVNYKTGNSRTFYAWNAKEAIEYVNQHK